MFFNLLVFNNERLREQSLEGACAQLNSDNGISMKKQSLHERFNEKALAFLKAALERVLEKNKSLDLQQVGKYKSFKRILIKDSVCFQIDESYADEYPGSGGSGSKASIRIQFEYDLISGKINDLSIHPFIEQDATNSTETLNLTQQGDLVMRDLAYINLNVLSELSNKGAFFLCRPKTNITIREKTNDGTQKFNFKEIRHYMNKNNITTLEKRVYIGLEKMLPVRLILHLLPDSEVEKRRRKRKKILKKKGRREPEDNKSGQSREYNERMFFNLFITNTEIDEVPTQHVWPLYRLRWQIELVFKIWKSICHIDKLKKVKKHRFQCYLYGRLIFIMLGWRIIQAVALTLFAREKKTISNFKAFKALFSNNLQEMKDALILRKMPIQNFIVRFYNTASRYLILEKRSRYNDQNTITLNCEISML